MTTLALSHLVHETPAVLQRIGNSFRALFEGIQDARTLSHRFEALSRLSDDELAAHGLKREDIPQAVFASIRS
jgi:uncharacterized protein YjiS (DUF1127 family)